MRGGRRNNAGRTNGWYNYETKVIRVPLILADLVTEYAHYLDDGNPPIDFDSPMLNTNAEQTEESEQSEQSQFTEEITQDSTTLATTLPTQKTKPTKQKTDSADFFQPLADFYNQHKPQSWAACNKLNPTRITGFKALYKEWGEETITVLTEALNFINADDWWRDTCSARSIDTLLRRGKITELADKFKAVYKNKSTLDPQQQERDRIRNAILRNS